MDAEQEISLTPEQGNAIMILNTEINETVKSITAMNPQSTEIEVGMQVAAIIAGNFLVEVDPIDAQRILMTKFTDKVMLIKNSFAAEIEKEKEEANEPRKHDA